MSPVRIVQLKDSEELYKGPTELYREQSKMKRDDVFKLMQKALYGQNVRFGKLPKGPRFVRIVATAMEEVDEERYSFVPIHSIGEDPLAHAMRLAFNRHSMLCLTPDLIYGYVTKSIAMHVNRHAEALRHVFVSHEGKEKLEYYRNPGEDWSKMFTFFEKKMREKAVEAPAGTASSWRAAPFPPDVTFSTSTPISRAHRSVLAMDALQNYYEFRCYTMCGMGGVCLKGTPEDWDLVAQNVAGMLERINTAPNVAEEARLLLWQPLVMDVLWKIARTAGSTRGGIQKGQTSLSDDDINEDWWRAMYKWNHKYGSGGDGWTMVTGWANVFFPFLEGGHINPWMHNQKAQVDPDTFPSYASTVPFTHVDLGSGVEEAMRAYAGQLVLTEKMAEPTPDDPLPIGTVCVSAAWAITAEDQGEDQ